MINNMKISTYGQGKNEVFFISGMFAGGWVWERVIKYLNPDECTVHSIQPALCELSGDVDVLIEAISEAIKERTEGPVVLAGNSLGALIAIILSVRHPELTKSLVISGSPGTGPIDLQLGSLKSLNMAFATNVRQRLFYNDEKVDEVDFIRTAELWLQKHTFINIVRQMKAANKIDIVPYVEKVNCDILGVWGANDMITPSSCWDDLFCNMGHSFCKIGESGHSPMYEQPKTFACFLSSLFEDHHLLV